MELDWTTFSLEIINFLVLLWILERFLYRPVMATLAERRSGIDRTLTEVRDKESRAAALQSQFESRLADWEREKSAARARFDEEIAAERHRQLESLSAELALEREREAAKETHRGETLKRELAAQSDQQARRFASELLSRIAGPELEARLAELFIDELAAIPDERLAALHAGQNGDGHGTITSAYPLAESQRARIAAAIDSRLGMRGHFDFVQNTDLLAGIRVSLGAWQLDFSLLGELGAFAQASRRDD